MLLSVVLLALRMFKSTVEKARHTISLLTYLTSDSYTVSKNSGTCRNLFTYMNRFVYAYSVLL